MRLAFCLAVGLAVASMGFAPATAHAEEDDTPEIDNPNAVKWGIGPRLRYVTMPTWLQNLFVQHSMPMTSFGFGLEAVRRKGNFDIVFGFEYETIEPEAGYYLDNDYTFGSGQPVTAADLDYLTFDGLALAGLDVTFLWHAEISPMFQIRYGGGLGVGLVLGDVVQEEGSCPALTSSSQLDDPGSPNAAGCTRNNIGIVAPDVPLAVPIVTVLLGLRVKITEDLNLNIEGGFRDMFFLGTGINYFF